MEILTRSERGTFNLGKRLARHLQGHDLILLEGDLGSGKTVFVKGLALSLGIGQEITSPTYVFMRSYRGKNFNLYHFDLYRLRQKSDLSRLDLDGVLGDQKGVFVVEWPEFFPRKLFKRVRYVRLRNLDEQSRQISIEGGC